MNSFSTQFSEIVFPKTLAEDKMLKRLWRWLKRSLRHCTRVAQLLAYIDVLPVTTLRPVGPTRHCNVIGHWYTTGSTGQSSIMEGGWLFQSHKDRRSAILKFAVMPLMSFQCLFFYSSSLQLNIHNEINTLR